MRALVIDGSFGLDHLRLEDRPIPKPQRGQVVLRMLAASLNYRDLLMVRGHYNPKQALPLIPGSDGVGEVVEIGPDVERVGIGDRVCPIFVQAWIAGEPTRERLRTTLGGPRDGTLTEYMLLDAEAVVRVPEYLTHEEAASLPCAAVTAWSALATYGNTAAGDSVLTQGTGGVSIFAVQLAKTLGLRVIATSSSEGKLQRLRALGADELINYADDTEWGKTARARTGGVGLDQVIDVGGGKTLAESIRATRPGGQISIIGNLSGSATELNLIPILMQNIRLQGVLVGHRDGFEALNRALAQHRLRPVVDRVFELSEARSAFERLASSDHFGKICLRIGS
jgi:NADPH:quinone reductase-like Zn-dependent oxidoreductase